MTPALDTASGRPAEPERAEDEIAIRYVSWLVGGTEGRSDLLIVEPKVRDSEGDIGTKYVHYQGLGYYGAAKPLPAVWVFSEQIIEYAGTVLGLADGTAYGRSVLALCAPRWDISDNVTARPGANTEASTAPADDAIVSFFERRLQRIFASIGDDVFEDGVETAFSRDIVACITSGYGSAIDALHILLDDPTISAEAKGEALRWVGSMKMLRTHIERRELLECVLRNPDPDVRDGAILGLASMDDPSAIRSLERARAREQKAFLCEDIDQVLDQLREAVRCRSSSAP